MNTTKTKINVDLLNLALSSLKWLQSHSDCGPIAHTLCQSYTYPFVGDSLVLADGITHIGFTDQTSNSLYQNNTCPTWPAIKFKMAVFTGPTKTWACLVTCDSCQPTKFKITNLRVRTYLYTSEEVSCFYSINISNSIPRKIILNGQINVYQLLTHAGQCIGRVWVYMWANVWVHHWSNLNGICYIRVIPIQMFMQTHNQIICIIIMTKDEPMTK